MAAGTTIKHKRKAGAFVGGELAAGELGLDVTNNLWYFSADGLTVAQISTGGGGGLPAGTKVYSATLTQTGTAAPVATVLQNTLGVSVTWSRILAGVYNGAATSGTFTANKTKVLWGTPAYPQTLYKFGGMRSGTNALQIFSSADNGTTMSDGILNETSLDVMVYP